MNMFRWKAITDKFVTWCIPAYSPNSNLFIFILESPISLLNEKFEKVKEINGNCFLFFGTMFCSCIKCTCLKIYDSNTDKKLREEKTYSVICTSVSPASF